MSFTSALVSMASRADGWLNTITGLGTERDKASYTGFSRAGRVDDESLESAFTEDDMAATICEAVPDHMLRKPFTVVIPDNKAQELAVNKAITELLFLPNLADALVWERAFGGSAIVLGCDDGLPMDQPLDRSKLRGIRYLNTLDRRDLIPRYYYANPREGKYGIPSVYMAQYWFHGISQNGNEGTDARHVLIHESRMLVFRGTRTTARSRMRMGGWGNSVLSRCFPALATFNSNWQSVTNMLSDASQGVFRVKGLLAAIAAGKESALLQRMSVMDTARSVARAILIDADNESFERKDTTMSGLPDLVDRTATRLSSAARMPVTVLHGISPAGLNATGESDIRNWYDQLGAERQSKVQPAVQLFVELLLESKDGPTNGIVPENWSIEWPPLWQETDSEKATTNLAKTQSDVALVQAGVLTPEEVAIRRAEELEIDVETREQDLASYKEEPKVTESTPVPPKDAAPEDTQSPTGDTAITGEEPSKNSLNGAQISALQAIVNTVSQKLIPREVGINQLLMAFPISKDEAERMMGDVGKTFFAPGVGEPQQEEPQATKTTEQA